MMNIYKIEQTGKVGWDQYEGFVIRAKDESHARFIAAEKDTQYAAIWMNEKHSSVEIITRSGDFGIILESFNAG
jgi:hypothetical protein